MTDIKVQSISHPCETTRKNPWELLLSMSCWVTFCFWCIAKNCTWVLPRPLFCCITTVWVSFVWRLLTSPRFGNFKCRSKHRPNNPSEKMVGFQKNRQHAPSWKGRDDSFRSISLFISTQFKKKQRLTRCCAEVQIKCNSKPCLAIREVLVGYSR